MGIKILKTGFFEFAVLFLPIFSLCFVLHRLKFSFDGFLKATEIYEREFSGGFILKAFSCSAMWFFVCLKLLKRSQWTIWIKVIKLIKNGFLSELFPNVKVFIPIEYLQSTISKYPIIKYTREHIKPYNIFLPNFLKKLTEKAENSIKLIKCTQKNNYFLLHVSKKKKLKILLFSNWVWNVKIMQIWFNCD